MKVVVTVVYKYISIQVPAFNSFNYIPKSEITRSYGNCVFNFFEDGSYFIISSLLLVILYADRKKTKICTNFPVSYTEDRILD